MFYFTEHLKIMKDDVFLIKDIMQLFTMMLVITRRLVYITWKITACKPANNVWTQLCKHFCKRSGRKYAKNVNSYCLWGVENHEWFFSLFFFLNFFQLSIYYFYNHKNPHILLKTCCRDEMPLNILVHKCCGLEYRWSLFHFFWNKEAGTFKNNKGQKLLVKCLTYLNSTILYKLFSLKNMD